MGGLKPSDSTLLENRWMRVVVKRTISAPPAEVWAVISDETSWLSWYRPLSKFDLVDSARFEHGALVSEVESWWKTTSRVVKWDDGVSIGLCTESINASGLLSKYVRELSLTPGDPDGSTTDVTLAGAFRFGILGWLLVAYTYAQAIGALYFEYRSALKGLAELFE